MRACVSALLGLALLPALYGQGAELYRVAGVVVNARTGAPLAKASVTVAPGNGSGPPAALVTGADGKFAFDLPEGKYLLIAGPRDQPENFGMRDLGSGFGTAVVTGPGQNTANLIFRWFPPSAISGRVVDQYGDPVEGAMVQALRAGVNGGRRRTISVASVRTDDRGEYRIGPILGGSYYLVVTGRPWYSANGPDGRDTVAFAPAYYPNAIDPAQAAPLVVAAGEEARADFNPIAMAGATVTVKSDAPSDQFCWPALIPESLGGSEGLQQTSFQRANGNSPLAVAHAVTPGAYTVRITCPAGGNNLAASQRIEVGGADLSIELVLRPNPAVSGSVQWKDPEARSRGPLTASLVREDGATSVEAAVQPNGSFTFAGVAAGRYRPQIRSADGYYASAIHIEGADYRDGLVELLEGQTVSLRIVASNELGRVKGFVLRDDQPMEGALVLLAPADPTAPGAPPGFQSDSDGSFDFQNVPTGDYLLFALEDLDLEYANPAVIKPYLAAAKQIRVEAHGVYSERISLSPAVK